MTCSSKMTEAEQVKSVKTKETSESGSDKMKLEAHSPCPTTTTIKISSSIRLSQVSHSMSNFLSFQSQSIRRH